MSPESPFTWKEVSLYGNGRKKWGGEVGKLCSFVLLCMWMPPFVLMWFLFLLKCMFNMGVYFLNGGLLPMNYSQILLALVSSHVQLLYFSMPFDKMVTSLECVAILGHEVE